MQPQNKALKQIKNSGLTIEVIGYFSTVVGFVALLGLALLQLNILIVYISLVISLIISVTYIILGHKIRKENPSSSTKVKFIIILVVSALILIGNFTMMSKSATSEIFPLATLVSSIVGLSALKKLQSPTVTK